MTELIFVNGPFNNFFNIKHAAFCARTLAVSVCQAVIFHNILHLITLLNIKHVTFFIVLSVSSL